MPSDSKFHYRLNAIKIIQQRAGRSRLWGVGIFIIMSISFSVSAILVNNVIKFSQKNILLVSKQPLLLPVLINGLLVSLYLALLASTSISREYNNGTLEILLVSPVDEFSFLFGNLFAQLKIFLLTIGIAIIWSYLNIWLLNFSPRFDIIAILIATLFMASELISFGMLTAVWGGKTKNAIIYFILFTLVLGGLQLANLVVGSIVQIESNNIGNSLVLVRNALSTINRFLVWVSPYSHLRYAMQTILEQRYLAFLTSLGTMVLETCVFFLISLAILWKKGVRGTK